MHTAIAGHVEKHINSANCIHMIYRTYVKYSATKICHKYSVGKKCYQLHNQLRRILILSWWTFSERKKKKKLAYNPLNTVGALTTLPK